MQTKLPKRRSVRLPDYDYTTNGAYFITIYAFERECLFGKIKEGKIYLSAIGEIIAEEWLKTKMLRDNVELGEYTVMPNHFHAILYLIQPNSRAPQRGTPTKWQSDSLGSIINQYKSAVTKRVKKNFGLTELWQRNYYEHIIRNDESLFTLSEYIINNPLKWELDELNPKKIYA